RHERGGENQEPAHRRRARLRTVCGWPLVPDHLADLEIAQGANEPRTSQQADRERRQAGGRRPERDVPCDVEHRIARVKREKQVVEHQPRPAFTASAMMSVRVPREPFTSTTSPGLTSATTAGAAASLVSKYDTASGGSPASTAASARARAGDPPTA